VRAVTITPGAGLEWAERPDPVPGDYELLVAVGAAGLNGADLLQRRGFYPPPAGIPEDIPGLEMAGVVVDTGPRTSRFKVGDLVMALVGGAAQAELALTDERTALPVPSDLDLECAGGFMEAAATAFDALFTQAGLGAGERLLVTGAAGGVGTCAVQLGEAAGATVIASTRHRELNNDLIELGALVTVLPSQCAEFAPFDVILELVSGPGLVDSVSCLATGGRLVVIGVGAGSRVELDMHVLMQKRARIMASTMRARPLADRALVMSALERRVLPLVESGKLIVPVAETFPMSASAAGYDRFAAGGKLGKIVLLTEGADMPLEIPAQMAPEN
jgi:NADPH:quinone reductase-like Zn-dependent oxidoreductase